MNWGRAWHGVKDLHGLMQDLHALHTTDAGAGRG